jgi:hypothetical protein
MDARISRKFRISQRHKRRLANQAWNELMKKVTTNKASNEHDNCASDSLNSTCGAASGDEAANVLTGKLLLSQLPN